MKKLSQNELLNLTTEKAWEVVQTFADFLQKPDRKYLEFETVLDYDRGSTLVSLLHLVKNNLDNKKLIETLCTNIAILLTQFIPDKKSYEELLKIKDLTNKFKN